jgi:hypothetical protein
LNTAAALCLVALAQDDGAKYLERIGKAWAKQLPQPRALTVYLGRRPIGELTWTVQKAKTGFEIALRGEILFMDRRAKLSERALLGPALVVLSGASTIEETAEDALVVKKTVSVSAGQWSTARDENEDVPESVVQLRQGLSWDGGLLPLFLPPGDAEIVLNVLGSDRRAARLKLVQPKRLEVRRAGEPLDVWLLENGQAVELRLADLPLRLRAGKDVAEPAELAAPERAVLQLARAIKNGDRQAAAAMFEVERAAEIVDHLFSPKAPDLLRHPSWLEEFFSAAGENAEKDGAALVRLPGGFAFRLRKISDGDWLINAIEGSDAAAAMAPAQLREAIVQEYAAYLAAVLDVYKTAPQSELSAARSQAEDRLIKVRELSSQFKSVAGAEPDVKEPFKKALESFLVDFFQFIRSTERNAKKASSDIAEPMFRRVNRAKEDFNRFLDEYGGPVKLDAKAVLEKLQPDPLAGSDLLERLTLAYREFVDAEKNVKKRGPLASRADKLRLELKKKSYEERRAEYESKTGKTFAPPK